MPWCPKCKCEYMDGFKRCSDCEVDLVKNLSSKAHQRILESESTKSIKSNIKFYYFVCLAIFGFIAIALNIRYENYFIQLITSLFMGLYLIGGSIISFYYDVPIFTINKSDIFKFEKQNITISNIIANIIFICLSIALIINAIKGFN